MERDQQRMPKFERLTYKPIPVRDLLLEMKNLSEIMIDLAYSAALFNDKELAEGVLNLEERIDTLAYMLDLEIMIASRGDAKDAEALIGVSKVAAATDKISDAAADIAAIVTRNIGVHPMVGMIFEMVEERISKATVDEASEIAGKPIDKLDLSATMGVDIIAIRRNKSWLINPRGKERIMAGDILITRGTPSGIQSFKDAAERDSEKKNLSTEEQERFAEIVTRFVDLKDTSELMIDLAYSALLLNSRELAEQVQFLEEYVDKIHTDFELLALTNSNPKEASGYLGLIRLGVATEKIADAATEMAEVVLRGIDPHPILKLTIRAAEETVTQACVSENSNLNNKTIKESKVHEKTGMSVLAIKRGEKSVRPKPDSKIQAGDILIASGYSEGADFLKKLASPDLKCSTE
jgi:uncharacterized protein with PhoU and TrkA domain